MLFTCFSKVDLGRDLVKNLLHYPQNSPGSLGYSKIVVAADYKKNFGEICLVLSPLM